MWLKVLFWRAVVFILPQCSHDASHTLTECNDTSPAAHIARHISAQAKRAYLAPLAAGTVTLKPTSAPLRSTTQPLPHLYTLRHCLHAGTSRRRNRAAQMAVKL